MEFSELRDSISLTDSMTYLNTGWAGPSPQSVLDRVRVTLEEEAVLGPASPQGLAVGRRVTSEAIAGVAQLMRANEEEIALTHGTTEGVNMVLHGIPWNPGDELVTANLEHPALASTTKVVAERYGITIHQVEVSPQATPEEMVSSISDSITSRTRLVALSHIQFTCGLRMPLASIAKIAHSVGALLLVDGAQTGGHIVLDMPNLGADFYAISGQKWLFGPTGTGALYVRKDLRDQLQPLFASSTAAASGRRAGARLFELTTNGPGLVAGFAEALRIHHEIGTEAIEARTKALGDRLRNSVEGVAGIQITSSTHPDTTCGLVSVAIQGMAPDEVTNELWERNRIVGRTVTSPAAVRLSAAPFNTESEMDLTASTLRDIAATAAKR